MECLDELINLKVQISFFVIMCWCTDQFYNMRSHAPFLLANFLLTTLVPYTYNV